MDASFSGCSLPRLPDFYSASTLSLFLAPRKLFRRFGDLAPDCTALPWLRPYTAPLSGRFSADGLLIALGGRLRCCGSACFILLARWVRVWRRMFPCLSSASFSAGGGWGLWLLLWV